ncbi:MAG: transketolase, partial [Synergistaceae bacterium]|nr:transketolase [Synergistaceae bacterium]
AKIVVPADPNQTDRATRWMLKTPGDIYLAVGRSKIDGLKEFAGNYEFKYGEAVKLRDGKDGSIFALGYMVQNVLKAVEAHNLNVSVYAVSSPLEPDMKAIREAAALGPILTVEDHHVNTGMGAIMLIEAARAGIALPKVKNLGVDHYGASGTSDQVRAEMKLSPDSIAEAFANLKG